MLNLFNKTPAVSPEETAQKVSGAAVGFIDVRSESEYSGGHARGAANIPLESVGDHAEELKQFNEVYVICASGGRSARAVQELLSLGVNALNVSGGTMAWRSAGLPMD